MRICRGGRCDVLLPGRRSVSETSKNYGSCCSQNFADTAGTKADHAVEAAT